MKGVRAVVYLEAREAGGQNNVQAGFQAAGQGNRPAEIRFSLQVQIQVQSRHRTESEEVVVHARGFADQLTEAGRVRDVEAQADVQRRINANIGLGECLLWVDLQGSSLHIDLHLDLPGDMHICFGPEVQSHGNGDPGESNGPDG